MRRVGVTCATCVPVTLVCRLPARRCCRVGMAAAPRSPCRLFHSSYTAWGCGCTVGTQDSGRVVRGCSAWQLDNEVQDWTIVRAPSTLAICAVYCPALKYLP